MRWKETLHQGGRKVRDWEVSLRPTQRGNSQAPGLTPASCFGSLFCAIPSATIGLFPNSVCKNVIYFSGFTSLMLWGKNFLDLSTGCSVVLFWTFYSSLDHLMIHHMGLHCSRVSSCLVPLGNGGKWNVFPISVSPIIISSNMLWTWYLMNRCWMHSIISLQGEGKERKIWG